jgi:hypothetical protein
MQSLAELFKIVETSGEVIRDIVVRFYLKFMEMASIIKHPSFEEEKSGVLLLVP